MKTKMNKMNKTNKNNKKNNMKKHVARTTHLGSGDLIEPQESANEKYARDAVQLCDVCCEVSDLRGDHF